MHTHLYPAEMKNNTVAAATTPSWSHSKKTQLNELEHPGLKNSTYVIKQSSEWTHYHCTKILKWRLENVIKERKDKTSFCAQISPRILVPNACWYGKWKKTQSNSSEIRSHNISTHLQVHERKVAEPLRHWRRHVEKFGRACAEQEELLQPNEQRYEGACNMESDHNNIAEQCGVMTATRLGVSLMSLH